MSLPVELGEPVAGNYFISNYPPFSCWNAAGAQGYADVLGRRAAPGEEPPLGLYLHIPFCERRCDYCYYLSHDDRSSEREAYLAALQREIELCAAKDRLRGRRPAFVYVGGGTPSLLSARQIEQLLHRAREALRYDAATEVTFECAPRSVSVPKLRVLRDLGVTRISIGVQQMDDAVLARSGRIHRVRDVERAWEAIAATGFDIVNVDLIAGLVGETEDSFDASLERVLMLAPDSVTIYLLEVPLNTPLYRDLLAGNVRPAALSWSRKRSRLRRGFRRLERAGYTQRSAYACVRDPDRHRFLYQELQYHGADLVGFGASSFSYVGGVNHQNRASLDEYLAALSEGELPLWRGHVLTGEERWVRELVLQLKLGSVQRWYFLQKFGIDPVKHFASTLARLEQHDLLRTDARAITCTNEGLLRVDRLLPLFYDRQHRGVRYS